MEKPNPHTRCQCLRDNLLVILSLCGVVAGLAVGLLIRTSNPSQDAIIWISLPGDIFMQSLKMLILPLIMSSIITATASMDPKSNGRISLVSLIYILGTNSLACLIPIAVAMAAKPGRTINAYAETVKKGGGTDIETIDIFADMIRNLFPSNIISACFEQSQTKYKNEVTVDLVHLDGNSSAFTNVSRITKIKFQGTIHSTNVLGLVVFSFIIGVATSSVGKAGETFNAFFLSANAVIIKVLSWLIWTTPFGVASLIASAVLKAEDLDSVIKSLGFYSLVVIGCLLLHILILTTAILLVMMRTNPLPYFASWVRACLISFATTSTAVAIPETLYALENKNGVDSRVTRFVVPITSIINRDGSSVYLGVSCVFISQLAGIDLNGGQVISLWLLITAVSIAIPPVPSSSIVVINIVLASLGIPTRLVGLLFATEWLLDRLRTTANQMSHFFCALVTYHICKGSLPPLKESDGIDMKTIREQNDENRCPDGDDEEANEETIFMI